MLQIDDKIVSLDVFNKFFLCNVKECKGICCVEGDSGAPLELEEAVMLEKLYPKIKSYIRLEGIAAIEEHGIHMIDSDGDVVTPLIDGKECAYTLFKNGIASCAIEKAYEDGVVKFRKPISCHLYPIRIKNYKDFQAVNYKSWDICKSACRYGKEKEVRVFEFLKDPLILKFGKQWYRKLETAYKELKKNSSYPID